MRRADGHRHLVPLVISQAVREHLGVRLLAFGTIVKTHLTALAAALQLQEPAEEKSASSLLHTRTAIPRDLHSLHCTICLVALNSHHLN